MGGDDQQGGMRKPLTFFRQKSALRVTPLVLNSAQNPMGDWLLAVQCLGRQAQKGRVDLSDLGNPW